MKSLVQYARTSDGVSIAYRVEGEGPPLVSLPSPPLSHVQRGPELMPHRIATLTRHFRLIWYDSRGSGLSDRSAIDFSMRARLLDLEAVMAATVTGTAALTAAYDGVPTAIAYAAAHPETVSHLALVDGWSTYSDYLETPTMAADELLRGQDWIIYTETLARVMIGFDDPALAQSFGAYIRECVEPDALMAAWQSLKEIDVVDCLPRVRAATLIAHNSRNRFLTVESGKRLATAIPGAQFRVVDDMDHAAWPEMVVDFILRAPS